MTREIKLEDFILAFMKLWKYKVIIFLVTLLGLFAGFLYTYNATDIPIYTAKSSVYCSIDTSTNISLTNMQAMVNYSDVVKSNKVCEKAASIINNTDISAEGISNMINVTVQNKSYVIYISAIGKNSDLVVKVANAVAEAFISEMVNITGSNYIKVLDLARKAQIVRNKDTNVNRLMFGLGAFFIISGIIVISSLLSDKVQLIVQCVENEDEILGIIPDIK
jgi:capsular polysaccharide biosynthesis protein